MPQVTVPTKQCLRCGKRFPSRNKLMQHLFPSSSDPFPCSNAPGLRSDRQVQQRQGSNFSFSGPRQTDRCPSQASLSSSQPSAVTSLPRSQPSPSKGQSSHPSPSKGQSSHPPPSLSANPDNTVGTQLNAFVGGGDRSNSGVYTSSSGVVTQKDGIKAYEKRWMDALERLVPSWKEQKIPTTETSITALPTGSTVPTPVQSSPTTSPLALPRPPSSLCSDSSTDNGIPIAPQSSVGLTYPAGYANDSSDDPDGHLDCRDRSTYETSPGQGRHHCGSGTYNGGYDSVRNNDGDTEELYHDPMPRVQGSGSSYEDEDSGDNYPDGPDDHPTSYVEDYHDYSNEDYREHNGYDEYNGYNDHSSYDDYGGYGDYDNYDDYYD